MICSRISVLPVSAYWRNRASTRLTASSSPGRTSATAGFDPIAWIMGAPEVGRPRGLGGRVELGHFYAWSSRSATARLQSAGGNRPGGASSGPDGEEPPLAADALEGVGAAVLEHVVRPGDQVVDGAGHQHLAGSGGRHHPGRDMHADAADVVAPELDLAGVDPGPDLDPAVPQPVTEAGGAADPAAGPVEQGQDAVAGRLDQPALELADQLLGEPVVEVEQLAPAAVADPPGELGRPDDIGEQDGGQGPLPRLGGRDRGRDVPVRPRAGRGGHEHD